MISIVGRCHVCERTRVIAFCGACRHWFCAACAPRWAVRAALAVKERIAGRRPRCCGPDAVRA